MNLPWCPTQFHLNHQIILFSGDVCLCFLWKGHMTSVGLRKSILPKQILFHTYCYIHHLRENTLNTSHVWAIMTPANQFSSPNWVATDLPQLGVNSFQHTAGASSWSCIFFFLFLSWHASSFYALWKSALWFRSSHHPNSAWHRWHHSALLLPLQRLSRVQLRSNELQCHVAHFSTVRTPSE